MRILRFFFTSLLQIGVLGLIVFLAGREILLVVAASDLKSAYQRLTAKSYGQECLREFGYSQDFWTQLRFVSPKQYQLEVVCADFVAQPVLLESKTLPAFVSKTDTGSGFIIDQRKLPYSLRLSVAGRAIFVFSEEHKLYSRYLAARDLDYSQGPVTACQGHGYTCCMLDVQSGQGEQVPQVADCPRSCFESCQLRPVILSFNSRPAVDFESRVVVANPGQPVTFSYVIGNGKSDVFANQLERDESVSLWQRLQVLLGAPPSGARLVPGGAPPGAEAGLAAPLSISIDFGDGQTFESSNLQDSTDHLYTCRAGICMFTATLRATDALGVAAMSSDLSQIIVRVAR